MTPNAPKVRVPTRIAPAVLLSPSGSAGSAAAPPGPLSGRPVFRCGELSSTVSTEIELSCVHSLIKSPPLAQRPVQPEPPAQKQAPPGAPPQLPSWSSTEVVGGAHHSSREDFDIYVVPAH